MDPVNLFTASQGLNTLVDPTRISFTPESGVTDLAIAVNINHDKTGRPYRRPGTTEIQSGAFHSLFCDGGDCYVCKGSDLYLVNRDYSLTGIRSDLSGDWIDFAQVGNVTYYTNGRENGLLGLGSSAPWVLGNYVGPETTKQFSRAPVGHHLANAFGRMFVAEDNILWYSELYAYGRFNLAKNFVQFNSKILMIKAVEQGLFVSDEKNIYFLRGANPTEFIQEQKTTYPALEWSAAIDYIEALTLGIEAPGLCIAFGSTQGAMLGTSTGQLLNLTENKIKYPPLGSRGAGLITDDNFIHSLFF